MTIRNRRRSTAARTLAVVSVMTLIATLCGTVPAAAAPRIHAPKPQHDTAVPGHLAGPGHRVAATVVTPFAAAAPIWPAAVTTTVDLAATGVPAISAPSAMSEPVTIRATGTPVSLARAGDGAATASDPIQVHVFDHTATVAAGIDGVMLLLHATSGTTPTGRVNVSVDYAAFRGAYGGDWSSRLRLVTLTGCTGTAVPTGCRMTALPSHNDFATDDVSATVALPASAAAGVLVAATASPSGSAGSFAATSLQASGSWSVSGNSGDFQWSYPLRTPPAVGGPAPSLALSYDSAAVDGQMATSNNQPSWVGEGFDLTSGFIERSYKACSDDMGGNANNTTATGDECWATNNATLALAGHNGDLIQDSGDPNRWHLRGDDGTYIRHQTGASNGDNDGEWWVVTTPDGTQYWFGKNAAANNSTWTEPVYGNNNGEPCNAATFAASSCSQAYRWNLDHVVDPSGNTMDYYYTTETNEYAADDNPNSPVSYIRGGYLNKITYGTRTGSGVTAPMRVVFTPDNRCVTVNCGTHDAANWPDTPWDEQCTAAPCYVGSPTFWITDRLATVQTQLYSGTGTTYNPVTTWTLTHTMPDPGDGTDAGLWLAGIVQTGQDGTPAISLPAVTFVPQQLRNRVDTLGDNLPPMNWMRIASITTESGEEITVSYTPTTCVAGTHMPDPTHLENNTDTCYPVIWTPPGDTAPITDFFNKYTVAQVDTVDLTTPGTPTNITTYTYLGNPAWHYTDADEIVPDKQKTWSVWRGYPTVETDTGTGADKEVSRTTYFQGMNGDHMPSGTRSMTLPAVDLNNNGTTTDSVDVAAAPDEDTYAGMPRESITYNGPGGAEISATVNDPWESAPTASRTINGVTVNARYVGIQGTHTRTDLDNGRAPRTTSTRTVFDTMGEPVEQQDNGNDVVTGDEKCTLTDYARAMPSDGSTWLVDFPYRVRLLATDCTTALAGHLAAAQVDSDTLTYYDGSTVVDAALTRGLVTRTDQLKDWVNAAPVYLTTATIGYDADGRAITGTDVRGNTTTMAYATNAGGQLITTTTTAPLGWTSTVMVDPATGLTTHGVDANGRVTDETYDALGRLTAVWKPGRDKASQTASATYAYLIRDNAPTVVTTSTLTPSGGYVSSYALYDGLLRPRQSQQPRGDGTAGALVTDTFYDTAGRADKTYSPYLAAITPGTTLYIANAQNVPQQTQTVFDGAGRPSVTSVYDLNTQGVVTLFAATTITYGGDRVDVTPPAGGIATSTIEDAQGNTAELRQYHGPTPTPYTPGSYDSTTYTYDAKEQLIGVADPAGNHWSTTYDIRGRVIATGDPDSGASTTAYDDAGDVTSTTDARGVTINYTYDAIGRKTGDYAGAVTSADQLDAWVYDGLTNSQGQLTKTISYDNGNAYTTTINGLTADYQPTSVTYAIPAAETGLAGSYTYVYTYKGDGSLATTRLPDIDGVSGLPLETLTPQYTNLGQPAGLQTSIPATTSVVPSISYTGYGEPAVVTLATNGGNQVYLADTYDPDNRRLTEQATTKQTSATAVADLHYTYDTAGNLTESADSTSGDDQCYAYDYLDRLSSAWTPASGSCTATKTVAALGGPAPYWDDWTFDTAGTRTRQITHDTPAGTATTTYTVPAPGAAQPHAVTATATVAGTTTTNASYSYNQDGDTTARPSLNGTANEVLTYNSQGQVATVTDNGTTTSYTYDIGGSRFIQRDATGKTLYLPGQELRYTTATGAKATTRYYSVAGSTVAMRTSTGLTWLVPNRQGTGNITIDAVSQSVTQRFQDPYGNPRGTTTGTWPAADNKGYLGGTLDGDGLTHLGAREYDPGLGRFTSVDPFMARSTPQRFDGYAYCSDNPIGATDPTGTSPSNDNGGSGGWDYQFSVGPYAFNYGGYHYQEIDLIYFWCRDSGSQCLGGLQFVNGEWLDQSYGLSKNEVEWWISMSDIATWNGLGYLPVFDALEVSYISATPLAASPSNVCTNIPQSYIGAAPAGTHPMAVPGKDCGPLWINCWPGMDNPTISGLVNLAVNAALIMFGGALFEAGDDAAAAMNTVPYDPAAMGPGWWPRVSYADGITAIGNDPDTLDAFDYLQGVHQPDDPHFLIMHGTENGGLANGALTPDVIAGIIRGNPSYVVGTACEMYVCYSAGAATLLTPRLSEALGGVPMRGWWPQMTVNPDGSLPVEGYWTWINPSETPNPFEDRP